MITPLERLRELLEEAYRLVDQIEEPEATSDKPSPVTDPTVRESRTPQPAPTRAAKPAPVLRRNEVTYTGKIARPEFRLTRNGTPFWTAGLGIDQGNGDLEWINLQAWKQVATRANDNFDKGDVVTIIGKPGVNRYTDRGSGLIVQTEVIIVTSIDWAE